MANSLQQLGYNEFMERNVFIDKDPLGIPEFLRVGLDGLTTTSGGANPLFYATESQGYIHSGAIPVTNSDGKIASSIIPRGSRYMGKSLNAAAVAWDKNKAVALFTNEGFDTSEAFDSPVDYRKERDIIGTSDEAVSGGNEPFTMSCGPFVKVVEIGGAGLHLRIAQASAVKPGTFALYSSSTFGITGGTYSRPGILSLGKTAAHPTGQGLITNGKAGYFEVRSQDTQNPGIGKTIGVTLVGSGYRHIYSGGTAYMEASDALGGNTTKRIWRFIFSADPAIYFEVNGAGVASIGKGNDIAVTPNAGTDRSKVTFSESYSIAWSANLTNTVTAGAGSSNAVVRINVNKWG